MKLVTKRDFANVPRLGLTIDPKVPGFKHPNHVHKGYRFEIGTAEKFDDLSDDDKKLVAELMVSQATVAAADTAEVAKIDAEVATDREREKQNNLALKRAKREPWTRAHKLQIAALSVSIVAAIIGFSGWYHAAHQSPIYHQQIELQHETRVLAKYLSKISVDFDKDQMARADFASHDFVWVKEVTDNLTKEGLDVSPVVDIYDKAQQTGGLKGETLKEMSDQLTKLANQLPNTE